MFVGFLSEGKTGKLELCCVSLRSQPWALQNADKHEHRAGTNGNWLQRGQ